MNEFNLVSNVISEASVGKFIKRGTKRVWQNMKKDPVALGMVVVPVPGSAPLGAAYHMSKNQKSRKMVKLMGAKFMRDATPGQKAAVVGVGVTGVSATVLAKRKLKKYKQQRKLNTNK
jgi:hypothetical protein